MNDARTDRAVAKPLSLDQWLDLILSQPPTPTRGIISAAQAVREAREERAEHLARILSDREKKRAKR